MLPFSHKIKLWGSGENATAGTREAARRREGTTAKMEQMCKKATQVLIDPLGAGSPAGGALRKRKWRGSGEKGGDGGANEAIGPLLVWRFSKFLLFCVAGKDAQILSISSTSLFRVCSCPVSVASSGTSVPFRVSVFHLRLGLDS